MHNFGFKMDFTRVHQPDNINGVLIQKNECMMVCEKDQLIIDSDFNLLDCSYWAALLPQLLIQHVRVGPFSMKNLTLK